MKKVNFPLLIGTIIVAAFIFIGLWPEIFTDKDPIYEEQPCNIEYKVDGKWVKEFSQNPKPPNKKNVFGTDDAGRDIYSRLIYGTTTTLKVVFLVGLFRMIIALPMGMVAGMGSKLCSGIIRILNTMFTAIPMVIFCFIVLNIQYFRELPLEKSIRAFAIVLTLVGWPKLASVFEDSTKNVMEEDFIEGELAIGKSKFQIGYQNVLPHIIPSGISLFFKEVAMALGLIAQLAVFYVFIGATREIRTEAFRANYEMSLEPEWGASLSRIASDMKRYTSTYWLVLYTVITFTIANLGLNLLGEGLKIEFEKRESRVITIVKKILNTISPKTYINELRRFRLYKKPVIIKTAVVLMVVLYFIIPWKPSRYDFDIEEAKEHLQNLSSAEYEGRCPGTEGGMKSGDYIIEKLKSYGYEVSVSEIEFVDKEKNIPKPLCPVTIKDGTVKVKNSDGSEREFKLYEDFYIYSVNAQGFESSTDRLEYKGTAVNLDKLANMNGDSEDIIPVTGDFEYMSSYGFDIPSKIEASNGRQIPCPVKFITLNENDTSFNTYVYNCTNIIVKSEMGEYLMKGQHEVEISFSFPELPKYNGRNIIAFMPGEGKTAEYPGETVILGAAYDGIYNGSKNTQYVQSITGAATTLEIAKTIASAKNPMKKSVEFIFWDNDNDPWVYSDISGPVDYSRIKTTVIDMAFDNGYYYFDVGNAGSSVYNDSLVVVSLPAQTSNKRNYPMILEIDKRLKELDVDFARYNRYYDTSNALGALYLNARSTLSIGTPMEVFPYNIEDNMDNVNYKLMDQIGQIYIDILTMNEHVMD